MASRVFEKVDGYSTIFASCPNAHEVDLSVTVILFTGVERVDRRLFRKEIKPQTGIIAPTRRRKIGIDHANQSTSIISSGDGGGSCKKEPEVPEEFDDPEELEEIVIPVTPEEEANPVELSKGDEVVEKEVVEDEELVEEEDIPVVKSPVEKSGADEPEVTTDNPVVPDVPEVPEVPEVVSIHSERKEMQKKKVFATPPLSLMETDDGNSGEIIEKVCVAEIEGSPVKSKACEFTSTNSKKFKFGKREKPVISKNP